MTDKEIVLAFVNAINDHDVDKIYDLMTDDHIFIDGSGGQHIGKRGMKEGWQNYYKLFPDYDIQITDVVEDNSITLTAHTRWPLWLIQTLPAR